MTSGLAIYDTMQYIRPKVSTLCMGQAASIAALLLTTEALVTDAPEKDKAPAGMPGGMPGGGMGGMY